MRMAILGTHSTLGLLELKSLDESAQQHSPKVALFKEPGIIMDNLGGTIKLGVELKTIPTSAWEEIKTAILELIPNIITDHSSKFNLGISIYGFQPPAYQKFCWQLKKDLRRQDLKPRLIVASQGTILSSAQVIHNDLATSSNYELLISIGTGQTVIGRTSAVQDIAAYGQRDHGRPCRDARIGMLPPKLAQIMLNLAAIPRGSLVLDPFCGSGVILQEALLMGYEAFGSDINPRMVACSRRNLEWLSESHSLPAVKVIEADATNYKWPQVPGGVVCEGYLGPPLHRSPAKLQLNQLRSEANELYSKTLHNLAAQLPVATPLCLALPCWKLGQNIYTLPLVDHLLELGYTLSSIAKDQPLIYRRPQSIVGRQLLVIKRV